MVKLLSFVVPAVLQKEDYRIIRRCSTEQYNKPIKGREGDSFPRRLIEE